MDQIRKHRTEITIETHSVTTIRRRESRGQDIRCSKCGEDISPTTQVDAGSEIDDEKDRGQLCHQISLEDHTPAHANKD